MSTLISDDDKNDVLDALDTAIMYLDDSSYSADATAAARHRETYKRIAGKEHSISDRR